jgi:hypothetical protein
MGWGLPTSPAEYISSWKINHCSNHFSKKTPRKMCKDEKTRSRYQGTMSHKGLIMSPLSSLLKSASSLSSRAKPAHMF